MSFQIKSCKHFQLNFLWLLLIASLLHFVMFMSFTLMMKGSPEKYRIDMIFWGGILRKEDLVPQLFSIGGESPDPVVFSSSELLKSRQTKSWQIGVMVDKPLSGKDAFDNHSALPQKFLTERVDIEDESLDLVPGIPEAPRVPLKEAR